MFGLAFLVSQKIAKKTKGLGLAAVFYSLLATRYLKRTPPLANRRIPFTLSGMVRLPLLRFMFGWLLLPVLGWAATAAEVPDVAPADAAARVQAGTAVLVDVREPAEWKDTGVVATAHLLALSDLRGEREQWKAFLEAHRDQELILYCRSGNRSGQAAQILAAEGFRVANAGGLRDWIAADQPTRAAQEPPRAP